jgi:hypothetical protein
MSALATKRVAAHCKRVPRYFFDLYDDIDTRDDEGSEAAEP